MEWTREKPKKPGWYWLRWDTDEPAANQENITLAHVCFTFQPGPITPEMFGGDLEVYTIGNDAPHPLDEDSEKHQWAGPIEPPDA